MCNLNYFYLPGGVWPYAGNILQTKRQINYIRRIAVALEYIWFALVPFIMYTGPPELQSVNE